jgi:N6-L-threonylcarbamoyladenine synthase
VRILAIESSCDETSAAVLDGNRLLSNIVATQTVHTKFGGVVPELASRAHQQRISATVKQAFVEAGFSAADVEGVAVTQGPGLIGALLVGVGFAKGFALRHNIPLVGVNHVDAHLFAAFIENPELTFPFLGLIVSGGHTMLVRVDGPGKHFLLGTTLDDAAGEAFDKTGKMLGLPYPAGPLMDKLAKEGNPGRFVFPRSRLDRPLDFSFSGLKTSVLYFLQKQPEAVRQEASFLPDVCAGISAAITDVLVEKTVLAAAEQGLSQVVVAGGVSANSMLRAKLQKACEKRSWKLTIPKPALCTDNAAMIGALGRFFLESGKRDELSLVPFASYPFASR